MLSFRSPSRLGAVLTIGGALCSCGDTSTPTEVRVLRIDAAAAQLTSIGDTVRLAAWVRDARWAVVAGASITWASSDPSVATVSDAGLVTAVGNGSAEVAATSGSLSARSAVTVRQQPRALTLSEDSTAFAALQDTVRWVASVSDAGGTAVTDASITWASSDGSVATVSADGLVTAVGNGRAEVTATSGSLSARGAVTVRQQPSALTLSEISTTFTALGDTVRLVANVRDAGGLAVVGTSITWASSDPSVATASADGLVTAVGNGAAEVTATIGLLSAVDAVTVQQQPAALTLSEDAIAFAALRDTVRLAAWVRDAGGTFVEGASIAWVSSDESVATVSAGGLVTAVGDGSAEITATSGAVSARSAVTVDAGATLEIQAYAPAGLSIRQLAADAYFGADTVAASPQGADRLALTLDTVGAPDSVELRVGAAGFYPSQIVIDTRTDLGSPVTVVLVPETWTIDGGTYDGAVVPVSPDLAFTPRSGTCGDRYIGPAGCSLNEPIEFSVRQLPVSVAFARDSSDVAIQAADSVAFWTTLERSNSDLGMRAFQPAVYGGWTEDPGTVYVVVDTSLTSAGTAGRQAVTFRSSNWFAAVVRHELHHVLSFGHACYFPSVTTRCGAGTPFLSVEDVGYTQWYYSVIERTLQSGAQHGLEAALRGERKYLEGLEPLPGGN